VSKLKISVFFLVKYDYGLTADAKKGFLMIKQILDLQSDEPKHLKMKRNETRTELAEKNKKISKEEYRE
jgi:hypothetical protein